MWLVAGASLATDDVARDWPPLRFGCSPVTTAVRLATRVGDVDLANPVMTASGTAGHGVELAPFLDLAPRLPSVTLDRDGRPRGNPADVGPFELP